MNCWNHIRSQSGICYYVRDSFKRLKAGQEPERIITVIDSLPELQAAVIQERYLHLRRFGHFQRWEEIAGSLCYGADYIRQVHSKALKNIETILETGTLDT